MQCMMIFNHTNVEYFDKKILFVIFLIIGDVPYSKGFILIVRE